AVVYEMVTGRKAFDGPTQASVIAAIIERTPPAVSTLQPLTPPPLGRAIARCLEKDPDARWQNAGDLAAQLRDIAAPGAPSHVATRMFGSPRWLIAGSLV